MSTALSPLLAPMLSSAAMRGICDDAAYLQNMLDFEAALARAEAAVGVIPHARSRADCASLQGQYFDIAARWPRLRPAPAISPFPSSRR